jgi:hypothetical protein
MAQREGSIYLYLFIGTFVLFVAMLVVFFVQDAKRSELEVAIKKANEATAQIQVQKVQLQGERNAARRLVGGPEMEANWPPEDTILAKIKEAGEKLNQDYKRLGEVKAAFDVNNLLQPIEYQQELISKILDNLQQARGNLQVADKDKIDSMNQAKVEAKKSEEIVAGLRTQVTDTESKYVKEISDVKKDNERLVKELQTSNDQKASAEIDFKRQLALRGNQVLALQQRIAKLEDETRRVKTIDDVDPDGQILEVASANQIGWINIGRRQHLRPGLDFQVFQNVKGGKRQYKGRIEVQQVDETMSRIRILDTRDELNPIAKGDYITSPFYDPKAVPVFVFAGEGLDSKNVTQEGLRAKLKSYGAEIKDKVDLNTSFLIGLKGYEKDNNYSDAKQFGVAVIREREILEYMGL